MQNRCAAWLCGRRESLLARVPARSQSGGAELELGCRWSATSRRDPIDRAHCRDPLPSLFRTVAFGLFHAAGCSFRYSTLSGAAGHEDFNVVGVWKRTQRHLRGHHRGFRSESFVSDHEGPDTLTHDLGGRALDHVSESGTVGNGKDIGARICRYRPQRCISRNFSVLIRSTRVRCWRV